MGKYRKAVDEIAKKEVKKNFKKNKPAKVPLYTDEEKKKLNKLYRERRSIKKEMDKLSKQIESSGNEIVTMSQAMSMLNSSGRLNPIGTSETEQGKKKEPESDIFSELYKYLYSDEYETRDFREWMLSEGDTDLLEDFLEAVNLTKSDDEKIKSLDELDELEEQLTNDFNGYADMLSDIEKDIQGIRDPAKKRKLERTALELARREKRDSDLALIDLIDEKAGLLKGLTNPEKAALEMVKKELVKTTLKVIDIDIDDPNKSTIQHAISEGIMKNPLEGIRVAIKETVSDSIKKEFGDDAGSVAGAMVDFMTGKGSGGSVGLALFKTVTNKMGIGGEMLSEVAEDIVSSDAKPVEALKKQYTADLVMDVAKEVLKSGGNIYLAAGKIVKDVLFDTVKYTNDIGKAKAKENEIKLKNEEGSKKVQNEGIENILSKYEQ